MSKCHWYMSFLAKHWWRARLCPPPSSERHAGRNVVEREADMIEARNHRLADQAEAAGVDDPGGEEVAPGLVRLAPHRRVRGGAEHRLRHDHLADGRVTLHGAHAAHPEDALRVDARRAQRELRLLDRLEAHDL